MYLKLTKCLFCLIFIDIKIISFILNKFLIKIHYGGKAVIIKWARYQIC